MHELNDSIELIKRINHLTGELLNVFAELNEIEVSKLTLELGDVIESTKGIKYMVTKDELNNKYTLVNLNNGIIHSNKYDIIEDVVCLSWINNSKDFKLIKKNITL